MLSKYIQPVIGLRSGFDGGLPFEKSNPQETQILVIAPIFADTFAELVEGKKFEHMREDGFAVVHWPSLPNRNGYRMLES